MSVRQFSWWAGLGAEPEVYSVNDATRDGVIAAARDEFGSAEWFTIVEATQDGPFDCDIFDHGGRLIEDVIERFSEENSERFGEDGFLGDIDQGDLAAHLNRAFSEFMAMHGGKVVVWGFTEQRHREAVAPIPENAS